MNNIQTYNKDKFCHFVCVYVYNLDALRVVDQAVDTAANRFGLLMRARCTVYLFVNYKCKLNGTGQHPSRCCCSTGAARAGPDCAAAIKAACLNIPSPVQLSIKASRCDCR